MELIDLLNSVTISNYLTKITEFPNWMSDCDLLFWTCLFLLKLGISSTVAFLFLRNCDHVVVSFSLNFLQTQNVILRLTALLLTIIVLIGRNGVVL